MAAIGAGGARRITFGDGRTVEASLATNSGVSEFFCLRAGADFEKGSNFWGCG